MQTIEVKATFITDFYGGAPAIGTQGILEKYMEKQVDNAFLPFDQGLLKRGEKAEDKAAEILSVFHRDNNNIPIIGPWMIRRCLVRTGETIFNAMKDKTHPKKDLIKNGIISIEPITGIYLFKDDMMVTAPSGIRTYTVSLPKRSFFKAYEWIPQGTRFSFFVNFDESMINTEHMKEIISKCGRLGVGAFRERFGKFENAF